MRILVCGGRDYDDYNKVSIFLNIAGNARGFERLTIIHGGAKGADSLAGKWAKENDVEEVVYYADWDNEGRSAGPKRNERMLNEGKPDCVVAFPGGRGTQHMVNIAKKKGVPVYELEKN